MENLSLDHVGYLGTSIERLRERWQQFGFAPTQPRPLLRVDPQSGEAVPLDQSSCHIVLEQGYIELTAVEAMQPSHHLYDWRGATERLAILALGCEQVDAQNARVGSDGAVVSLPAEATRHIDYGDRPGWARFRWFMLQSQETPEGLLCFVHNRNPERVFQAAVQAQPNGARALREVWFVDPEPARLAARYRRWCGSSSVESPGSVVGLCGGSLHFASAHELQQRFGSLATLERASQLAAIVVEVNSLQSTAAALDAAGATFERRGTELILEPARASGAWLVFREG